MPPKGSINPHLWKYKININFFKKWNSQMAYILGFTFADGNIHLLSLSWHLRNDIQLLRKINKALKSNYPIEKKKKSNRLRISNPIILQNIKALGVKPNKSKICKFPNVPEDFLRDFVRGFLDGDGWIITKRKKMEISVGFSNGSKEFLKVLIKKLNNKLSFTVNNLRKRERITKNKRRTITYMVEYYSRNAYKLIKYLYDDLKENDLFLSRKYQKQLKARKIYEDLMRGTKLWRTIEDRYKLPMEELLLNLHKKKGLDGVQTAKELGVHFSSVYRWLEKTKIRIPAKRGSKTWMKRVKKHYYQNSLIK